MQIPTQSLLSLPSRPKASIAEAAGEPKPDLVVDRFEPSNSFPSQGDRIEFGVQVRNQGSVASGPFTVEVSGQGMIPDRERVPGLAPGQSTRLRFGPANVGYSSFNWYDARVDVGHEVDEQREDNNWSSTSVSVRDPFPPRDPFPRPPRPPFPVSEK